jgi:hypothetical protein
MAPFELGSSTATTYTGIYILHTHTHTHTPAHTHTCVCICICMYRAFLRAGSSTLPVPHFLSYLQLSDACALVYIYITYIKTHTPHKHTHTHTHTHTCTDNICCCSCCSTSPASNVGCHTFSKVSPLVKSQCSAFTTNKAHELSKVNALVHLLHQSQCI